MSNVLSFPAQKDQVELFDIQLEFSVIGSLLKNSKTLDQLALPINPEYFYEPANGRLYDLILDEHKRGNVADTGKIAMVVAGEQWFKDLGARTFLDNLVRSAAHPRALDTLIRNLRDMNVRRRLRSASFEVAKFADDLESPIESVLMASESSVADVCSEAGLDGEWVDAFDLVDEVHSIVQPGYKADLIPTGLEALDKMMGGIRPGKMTVLAARASMGKSTAALAIATGMARAGYGVGMFSLEMDRREIAVKIGCAEAYSPNRYDGENPSPYFADRGELYDEQKEALVRGANAMRSWPLSVDDRAGLSPSQILPATRRLIRSWGLRGITPGCIIIDHLHVVKPEIDRGGNRVLELGDISGFLTDLAKQTGVAVLAMCQLNREVENRGNKDKRPQLSDLRGSGKIEEDAYAVGFIYRPEYYLREPEDKTDLDAMEEYANEMERVGGKLHFIIEKNRGGPRGEAVVNCSMKHSAVWS